MPSANKTATVQIEKIVAGGHGLARLANGMVVLIPHVLPGERVRVKIVRRLKDYAEGLAVEIEKPAPGRVNPPCPYYQNCGGCDLQHADYPDQLEIKKAILLEILARANVLKSGEGQELFEKPLASPRQFGYRQRIRLQVDPEGRLGYFRSGSSDVVQVSACLLAGREINSVLGQLAGEAKARKLLLNAAEVELHVSPAEGKVLLFVHFKRKPRPADCTLARELFGDIPFLDAIFFDAGKAGSGPLLIKEVDTHDADRATTYLLRFFLPRAHGGRPLTMTFELGGFCQVNTLQNEQVVARMAAWAEERDVRRVLDLHCGLGNFSLPIAGIAERLVGVDIQRAAIRSAERNAILNGLNNCSFLQGGAEEGARELVRQGERFDLVLLDPPRRGCAEVLPWLPGLGTRNILYLSCDPATMARDLHKLMEAGYGVDRMMLVDMFPQTHHIETLALLGSRIDPQS